VKNHWLTSFSLKWKALDQKSVFCDTIIKQNKVDVYETRIKFMGTESGEEEEEEEAKFP
jgi:hypothetical protein